MARLGILDSTGYAAFVDAEANFIEVYSDISNLSASGIAYAVTPKTTAYQLLAADMAGHKVFTNTGASGSVTITLPAGVANYKVGFYVDAAQTLKIAAAATEKIRVLASLGSAAGYIQSSTEGDYIELLWNGTEWSCILMHGDNWTDGTSTFNYLNTANVWVKSQKATIQTLTDGASIAWNMALGNDAKVTIAGARTLVNPSNPVAGQSGYLYIVQDGTGSRTIGTWGNQYFHKDGTEPVLSTAASAIDVLTYHCYSSTVINITHLGVYS